MEQLFSATNKSMPPVVDDPVKMRTLMTKKAASPRLSKTFKVKHVNTNVPVHLRIDQFLSPTGNMMGAPTWNQRQTNLCFKWWTIQ